MDLDRRAAGKLFQEFEDENAKLKNRIQKCLDHMGESWGENLTADLASEYIDLNEMGADKKASLRQEAITLFGEYFDAIPVDYFQALFDKQSIINTAMVLRRKDTSSAQVQLVGFFNFSVEQVSLENNTHHVVRVFFELAHAYRKGGSAVHFMLTELLSYALKNFDLVKTNNVTNFLYAEVVPVSYKMFRDLANRMYPSPRLKDQALASLYNKATAYFLGRKIESPNDLPIYPQEKAEFLNAKLMYELAETQPLMAYYLLRNPEFEKGATLPIILTTDIHSIFYMYYRYQLKRIGKNIAKDNLNCTVRDIELLCYLVESGDSSFRNDAISHIYHFLNNTVNLHLLYEVGAFNQQIWLRLIDDDICGAMVSEILSTLSQIENSENIPGGDKATASMSRVSEVKQSFFVRPNNAAIEAGSSSACLNNNA